MGHKPPFDHLIAVGELLGQPRFPKTLDGQLRVWLPAPGDPRGYCKGGIDLKQTRGRLTRLRVTSENDVVETCASLLQFLWNC